MFKEIIEINRQNYPTQDLLSAVKSRFLGNKTEVKKILLVVPPDVEEEKFNFEFALLGRYNNYPAYGLGVISTAIKTYTTVQVEILSLQTDVLTAAKDKTAISADELGLIWKNSIDQSIRNFNPCLVGITCMFTITHQSFLNVANYVKEIDPDLPIIAGGVHITNAVSEGVNRNEDRFFNEAESIDLFFVREAEQNIVNFVNFLNEVKAGSVRDIQYKMNGIELGAVFRKKGFFLSDNQSQVPEGEFLNLIPDWKEINPTITSYGGKTGTFYFRKSKDAVFATCLANRGCRAQCTFCSVRNFNGVGVRRREVDSVMDEIENLVEVHDVKHITWLDDDFLYNRKKSLELFQRLKEANYDLTWDLSNGVIAAALDEEIVAAMAESGCIGLFIGMESGNKEILRSIKKPGTVKNFLNAASILKKFPQIDARGFLIIGFPGETFAQITDTFEVAKEMALDWWNIQILQPLPNTPIFNLMVEQGLINPDDFEGVRFTSGQHGKSKSIGGKIDLMATDFKSALDVKDTSHVPTAKDLNIIWPYMIYHLNYGKYLRPMSKEKLDLHYLWLSHLTANIVPGDAFAQYFKIIVGDRLGKRVGRKETLKNLETLVAEEFWGKRFDEFNLSVSSLHP